MDNPNKTNWTKANCPRSCFQAHEGQDNEEQSALLLRQNVASPVRFLWWEEYLCGWGKRYALKCLSSLAGSLTQCPMLSWQPRLGSMGCMGDLESGWQTFWTVHCFVSALLWAGSWTRWGLTQHKLFYNLTKTVTVSNQGIKFTLRNH